MYNKKFIRFLFVGGFSAIINILSRILISQFFDYKTAVALAFLVAMTCAFALSKKYVFTDSVRSVKSEYTRFAMVNIVAATQVWLISVGLSAHLFPFISFQFYPELTAHIIGVISPVFTSYYGHKLFTFGGSSTERLAGRIK